MSGRHVGPQVHIPGAQEARGPAGAWWWSNWIGHYKRRSRPTRRRVVHRSSSPRIQLRATMVAGVMGLGGSENSRTGGILMDSGIVWVTWPGTMYASADRQGAGSPGAVVTT